MSTPDRPAPARPAPERHPLGDIVDIDRYPIGDPDDPRWGETIARTRRELAESGCSVLPNFVRADRCAELRAECASVAPQAYYDVETVNVYNTAPDESLPADHPGRVTLHRGNAFVARDQLDPGFVVHRIYADPAIRRFLAACFGLPALHELADPLSALTLNVVRPGLEHPWHFDVNEFTVSLLTQAATDGGVFEYCPNIRSRQAENFDDVRAVLTGDGEHLIRRLTLRPGDVQLFRGRYALHRVTPVAGQTPRHSAILAYSERPGVVGSLARTRQLFGRVRPEHHAADRRIRVDALLD